MTGVKGAHGGNECYRFRGSQAETLSGCERADGFHWSETACTGGAAVRLMEPAGNTASGSFGQRWRPGYRALMSRVSVLEKV